KEVVLPDGLSDEERANRHRRTLREARASAALSHPGVVTVHDVVDEDDRPWIVMELVRARSLQAILDEGGPLPPARAAEIGRQIAGALRAAHAMGVLHRDVKPANVLVAEDDRAVLTDFGIAQLAGDATLTGTGLLIGSPAYMAPERVNGDPAIPASDMWALGATLYAATEGRAPHHRGDAVAVLAAIVTKDVPPPRNAGPLAPVLAGLLERDPARRLTGDRAEEALKAVASGRTADGLVAGADTTTGTTAGTAPAGAGAGPASAAHPAQPAPPYAATPHAAPPHPPPGPIPATTAQYPPSAAPEPPGGEGRARSVVGPILAGAAVAAVILAVAGVLLWPDGSSGAGEGPQAKPTTVAQQSTSGPGDTPTPPETEPASTEPASTGDPDGTLPAGPVPARGPGFTIGGPRGRTRPARGPRGVWPGPPRMEALGAGRQRLLDRPREQRVRSGRRDALVGRPLRALAGLGAAGRRRRQAEGLRETVDHPHEGRGRARGRHRVHLDPLRRAHPRAGPRGDRRRPVVRGGGRASRRQVERERGAREECARHVPSLRGGMTDGGTLKTWHRHVCSVTATGSTRWSAGAAWAPCGAPSTSCSTARSRSRRSCSRRASTTPSGPSCTSGRSGRRGRRR